MASRGVLSHDPNLAQVAAQVEPAWRGVAENVGVGYSVKQLHDAFMGSTGHRNNILNPSYNRVGIGVVLSGGRIWVTVRFLEGPAIAGSTGLGPPPPPPGVPTVLTGDFNGDGNDDFLTYGPGSQADELWFGRDDRTLARSSIVVNGQYRPVAGDFDGDGTTEILWYVPGATADPLWNWNGSGWSSTSLQVNGTYSPFVGDFDGDGADDIFWYGPGTAGDTRWYGQAGGGFTSAATTVNGVYQPVVGDLDGQHGDDILWYAPGSPVDYLWYANAGQGQRQLHVLPDQRALLAVRRRPRRQRHRRRVLVRAGIRRRLRLVHLEHPWRVPQRQPHGDQVVPACGRRLRRRGHG